MIAGSLALLVIPAQLWFGQRVGRRELIGLGLSAAGLALLAVNTPKRGHAPRRLLGLGDGRLRERRGRRRRHAASGGRHERAVAHSGILLGAAAGVMLGVADVSVKALTGTVPGDPMSLSAPGRSSLSSAGVGAFFALARGLQVGGAIQVIAVSTIASNVAAVLGGILVFGDPVGERPARDRRQGDGVRRRDRRRGADAEPGRPAPAAAARLVARPRVGRRVAVVEHQDVAVRVAEVRHVADAAVERVGLELDALGLELRARRLDVVDLEGDRQRMGGEVEPERRPAA